MSTLLVDDTRGGADPTHIQMFPFEAEELFKLRTDRSDSYRWAQSLRFLVFDGADDGEGYPPRVDEDVEVTFKDGTKTTMSKAEFEANEPANVFSSTQALYPECAFCLQWPRFPRRKKPQSFRVVQFSQLSELTTGGNDSTTSEAKVEPCTHFVAVSYCCPRDSEGNPMTNVGTYRVRETSEDGTETHRLTRAPDNIVDSAVAFAIDDNLRMIWIDQECILQSNDVDRDIGIQAMDLVYEQAEATIGILDSCIMSEDYMYILEVLDHWMTSDDVPQDFDELAFARILTEFLTSFRNDRYHSRAWTFQEMLSASENGWLLFKMEEEMDDARELYGMSADTMSFSARILPLETQDITKVIRQSGVFSNHVLQLVANANIRNENTVEVMMSLLRAVHRLEDFHPQPAAFQHVSLRTYRVSPYGGRLICSAAVAMTLLKTRDNSRVADRLAILANLCGYEVRLDLRKVEQQLMSLTTCIIALSLLNGDMSLLTPEIYRPISAKDEADHSLQRLHVSEDVVQASPSWMPRIHEFIPYVRSLSLMPGFLASRRDTSEYIMRASCFSLPGYLWTVDRIIDMMPVKRRCEIRWRRLLIRRRNIDGVIIRHHEKERMHGYEDDLIAAELESLAETTSSGKDSYLFEFRDRQQDSGGHSSQPKDQEVLTLSADIIEEDKIAQDTLADILWEILLYLQRDLGEAGVANSVWHSVRADSIKVNSPTDGDRDIELPDEVGQILEFGKDKFKPFWRALQLDKNHPDDDSYHQIWMIERIMSEGCLWVGKCVTKRRYYFSNDRSGEEESTKLDQALEPNSRILSHQSTVNVLRELRREMYQTRQWDSMVDEYSVHGRASYSDVMKRKQQSDLETRMAVLDVDGPCEVFTPYDADVERLPRPECRSFSWGWVVETVHGSTTTTDLDQISHSHDDATSSSEDLSDVMRVLNKVKVMWEHMENPEYNFRFV